MYACKALNFLYELCRFSMGNKLRGLNSIHEQLKFSQLKRPVCDIILVSLPYPNPLYIHPVGPELLNVIIKCLALNRYFIFLEPIRKLLNCKCVVLVCLFRQDFHQIEKSKLLVRFLCHIISPSTL